MNRPYVVNLFYACVSSGDAMALELSCLLARGALVKDWTNYPPWGGIPGVLTNLGQRWSAGFGGLGPPKTKHACGTYL